MPWAYIVHIVANYIVWFVCVLSAAHGMIYLGFIIAVIISLFQSIFYWYCQDSGCLLSQTTNKITIKTKLKPLIIFSLSLTLLGISTDSLLMHYNIIFFESGATGYLTYISPFWMWGIWLNFAVTIFCCLRRWFKQYIFLLTLFFIGFCLAYYAGSSLGAAQISTAHIFVVGGVYAVLVPGVLYIYDYFYPYH